jgi:hypothetical protein
VSIAEQPNPHFRRLIVERLRFGDPSGADPYLVAAKGDVAVKVTTRNLELGREAAKAVLAKL